MDSDIRRALSRAAKHSPDQYQSTYMDNVVALLSHVADPRRSTSQIVSYDVDQAAERMRFSLVFNELSLLTMLSTQALSVTTLDDGWFDLNFPGTETFLRYSAEVLTEIEADPQNPKLLPAFVFSSDDRHRRLINELSDFIESGRALIYPNRSIMVLRAEPHPETGALVNLLDSSKFASRIEWEVVGEEISRPLSILDNDNSDKDHEIFDVSVPYLTGIPFKEIKNILDDEGDLVSGLRVAIKTAIEQVDGKVIPHELTRDVIDPAVDRLNRKLKLAINTHKFRVGGAAVGTAVLAYTAAATSGVGAALATIAGTGGLGLIGNEYASYREKVNAIKEDSYYFFWRCKEIKKRSS